MFILDAAIQVTRKQSNKETEQQGNKETEQQGNRE